MLIENGFELLVVLMALTYSRFARLPTLVCLNIFLFSYLSLLIQVSYDISDTPGYEIYYGVGGAYFLIMACMFAFSRDRLYKAVAALLFVQAVMSGAMLITDYFAEWHQFVNDKSIFVESFIVWFSVIKDLNPKKRLKK